MLVFIVGILLCIWLIIAAVTNTLVYFVIGLGAILLVSVVTLYVYKIREYVTRKKGRLDTGELIYCKYLLPFKGKGYHIIKFKYVDDKGKPRVRRDLVTYTDFELMFLEDDGMIDIMVYKSFAMTVRPVYKPKKKSTAEDAEEREDVVTKDVLKECPYCGYKTFESDFKCPMCGGDLEIKKKHKMCFFII